MKKSIITFIMCLTLNLTFSQTWQYQYKQEGSSDSVMYLYFSPPPNNVLEIPIYHVFADKKFSLHADTVYLDSCKAFKLPFPSNQWLKANGTPATLGSVDINGALGYTPLSAEVDGSTTNELELPAQSGQSGKFLQTNGSNVSWQTVLTSEVDGSTTNEIELPSQTGNNGKYLKTNGTNATWETVSVTNPAATASEDSRFTLVSI